MWEMVNHLHVTEYSKWHMRAHVCLHIHYLLTFFFKNSSSIIKLWTTTVFSTGQQRAKNKQNQTDKKRKQSNSAVRFTCFIFLYRILLSAELQTDALLSWYDLTVLPTF